MTNEQKLLVQSTFAVIAPNPDEVAEVFYNRLFEIDGSLRQLFKGDMKVQGKMFMSMIALSIKGLDNLAMLVPAVQSLGKRHSNYGVDDEHYTIAGQAFLWTLEKCLGDKFTNEVNDAWVATYTLLANTMKEAQHEEEYAQKAIPA